MGGHPPTLVAQSPQLSIFARYGSIGFRQSGPLPEVTIAKLLTRSGQPIGTRQDHAIDSMGISFPGSSVPWALKRVPVMTIMLARWVKRSRPAEANSGLLKRVSDPRLPSLTLNGVEFGNKKQKTWEEEWTWLKSHVM